MEGSRMPKSLSPVLLVAVLVAACSSTSSSGQPDRVPRNIPIPKDAKNPIVIAVDSSATVAQLTQAAEQTVSGQGIDMIEADRKRGIVETNRINITAFVPGSQGMGAAESLVFYVFAAGKDSNGLMVIEILPYYQPNPAMAATEPNYRVLVPVEHPGYQYALRLEDRLKQNLAKQGIEVLGVNR
jgi:hypothetical protein